MNRKFCDRCKQEMPLAAKEDMKFVLRDQDSDRERLWAIRTVAEGRDLCEGCRRAIVHVGKLA